MTLQQHTSDRVELTTIALFARMRDPRVGPDRRRRLREDIIARNLPFATRLAHRYRHRGLDDDDLEQIAALALVKAVDGFDPERGKPFFGYLVPTVTGELKRHFRDQGWHVRVGRNLQERCLEFTRVRAELSQTLGRSPTIADLAEAMGSTEEDVVETWTAANAYAADSLNAPVSGDQDAAEMQDLMGQEDPDLASTCDRLALRELVSRLPELNQYVVTRYFFGDATQEQIARSLGVSQMYVSRVLRRTLQALRRQLDGGPGVGGHVRRSRLANTKIVVPAVCAAMVMLLAGGCSHRTASGSSTAPAPSAPASASASPGSIVDVVARLEPSVVTIQTSEGLGSGVVYRSDGVVVTNAHVVGSARQVQVSFADGTKAAGRVTGSDELTDLAVVKVGRAGLPAVTVRPDLPRAGETALAIGSPLGFENTVTEGIISGVGRQIPASTTGGRPLVDLIQTDAAISPGNSGGALIDRQGRLVGINEAYIPPSAGAVSIGFAIPAGTVTDVADQLLRNGTVAHPYLGVALTTLTAETARTLGMKVDSGALVRQVQSSGPAAAAGLRPGDVIVSFNGVAVRSVGDIYAALRKVKPGDKASVGIDRNGQNSTVSVTLGTLSR
jgi:RNA polymerase sigma-70 factor (sigma-B/F/G subfamily)